MIAVIKEIYVFLHQLGINSFRYETTATDPITNNIYVNYNEPKPFNDYTDGYVADGAVKDKLIISGLTVPEVGGSTEKHI